MVLFGNITYLNFCNMYNKIHKMQKQILSEEFRRMQQLAGILNEEFPKPVPPLRIWSKKNSEGNETYYITNPVGGLRDR
jgi:hypothetical protein